uniref:Putative secreted protein n=1 Tax=Ixodes ricinus TaxID=34613 RepID=V5HJM0_IXORI
MKATTVVLCFLAAAVCVTALLPEKICRAPHAVASCDGPIKYMWYFDDGSNKCVRYEGCGTGYNDFGSQQCCRDSCPYGEHKPKRSGPSSPTRP